MNLAPRDVVLADLGDTFGHAQAGTRPCVVVSVANSMAILIPVTSNLDAIRFAHTVSMSSNKTNGLAAESIALLFQIRALDVRKIIRSLGRLTLAEVKSVNTAMKKMVTL
jgi:mRNA interferase MazF